MRLPLLLSIAVILSACTPEPPRTPPANIHVGAAIDSPGDIKAFLIPAGSADARIKLLVEAFERDIKLAEGVQAEAQKRFMAELSARKKEIAWLEAKMQAEQGEAVRLARVYFANQQAAGRKDLLPPSYRVPEFAAGDLPPMSMPPGMVPVFAESPPAVAPGFATNQARIDALVAASNTRLDTLRSNLVAVTNAARSAVTESEWVNTHGVGTLAERLALKPPAHVASAITNFNFLLTAPYGQYDLLVLHEHLGRMDTNGVFIATFRVWKLPVRPDADGWCHFKLAGERPIRSDEVFCQGTAKLKP